MTLARKIYKMLEKNKTYSNSEISDMIRKEFDNTTEFESEWYNTIYNCNEVEAGFLKRIREEVKKAMFEIVKTGYATTEVKQEELSILRASKIKGTPNVSYKNYFVRYWTVIK